MRALGWILLVVACGVGAWLWVSRDGSSGPPAAAERTATETTTPGAAPEQAAGADPEPAPEAERQRVRPELDGPTVDLQVVRFGTRETLSGAVVRFRFPDFDWNSLTDAERERLRPLLVAGGEEALLAEIGGSVVTDQSGRCRVPIGDRGQQVLARHGTLFGRTTLRSDDTERMQTLALREDRTLVVRVVEPDGTPAGGVDVVLSIADVERDRVRRAHLGETDDSGRVELPHCEFMAGDAPTARAELRARIPGGESEPTEVEVTAPPPEVTLVLPPCGSVSVRVVEADGEPVDVRYLGDRSIQLAAFEARQDDAAKEFRELGQQGFSATLDDHAEARFEHVGLARLLVARQMFGGEPVRFDGPTAAGEHVAAEIRRQAGAAVFVGRALDGEGRPMTELQIRIECRAGASMGTVLGRTDSEGRFRCHLGQHMIGDVARLEVGTDLRAGGKKRSAELAPRTVQAGENDLGDVTLAANRVMVGGTLIADDGADPRKIVMSVERWDGTRWNGEWNLRPHIAADGAFELRGSIPDGVRLRLSIRSETFLPVDPVECTVGSTDLRILLRTGGQVTAVFLVEPDVPARELVYRLRDTASPDGPDWRTQMDEWRSGQSLSPDPAGGLRRTWGGLTPGTYRLSVHCPGVEAPVVAVDELVVSGGPCGDPRLRAVDLRGRVRQITIRATDADGRPVRDPDAFVVVHSDLQAAFGYGLGRGAASVLAAGPVDLWVIAPGHLIADVTGVVEDRNVALERAPEIVLQVDPGMRMPDGIDLYIELEPKPEWAPAGVMVQFDDGHGTGIASCFAAVARVGSDGTARLEVRKAGEYRVVPAVGRGRADRYVHAVEPRTLRVDPANAGAPVTVRLDPDALRKAIDGLR